MSYMYAIFIRLTIYYFKQLGHFLYPPTLCEVSCSVKNVVIKPLTITENENNMKYMYTIKETARTKQNKAKKQTLHTKNISL